MKIIIRKILFNNKNGSDKIWGYATIHSDSERPLDRSDFYKKENWDYAYCMKEDVVSFWGKRVGPWSIKPLLLSEAMRKGDLKLNNLYVHDMEERNSGLYGYPNYQEAISKSIEKSLTFNITSFDQDFLNFLSSKRS